MLICQNGPETSFGGGQRNILLAEFLKNLGFDVDILLNIPSEWGTYDYNSDIVIKWRKSYNIIDLHQSKYKSRYLPDLKLYRKILLVSKNYKKIVFRYETTAYKSAFYFLNLNKIWIDFDDDITDVSVGVKRRIYLLRRKIISRLIEKAFFVRKILFRHNEIYLPNFTLASYYGEDNLSKYSKKLSKFPFVICVNPDLLLFSEFINSAEYSKLRFEFKDLKIVLIIKYLDEERYDFFIQNGVEVHSYVPSLLDYYSQSWCSLVLDRKKIGSHIKVIEAAFYSTIVVGLNGVERGFENLFIKNNLNKYFSNNVEGIYPILHSLFNDVNKVNEDSERIKSAQIEYYNFKDYVNYFKMNHNY